MANEFSDKFCTACGGGLIATAAFCTHCGSPVGPVVSQQPAIYVEPMRANKSKSTAVLLAVFLGAWSWLYTYKWNAKKFWLGITIPLGFQIVALVFNIATNFFVAAYPQANFFIYSVFYLLPLLLPTFVTILAVISNARMSDEDFRSYPAKRSV